MAGSMQKVNQMNLSTAMPVAASAAVARRCAAAAQGFAGF
jgi:hypothetical protein